MMSTTPVGVVTTGVVTSLPGEIDVFDMCFDVSFDVDLDEIQNDVSNETVVT